MNIKQISITSCETIYEVGYEGETYRLRLWVIRGGGPALGFADYGIIKRFVPTEKVQQKWTGWDKGHYPHQDPDNIQGPTFDVLPNGLADVQEFLLEFLPKRKAGIARAEERNLLRALGLNPDKKTWPKREAESEPRILRGYKHDDGGFVVSGSDVIKSLKKSGKILNLDGCIFATTILRQYASIWRKEALIIYPPNGANEIKLVVPDCGNRATVKHGARDKFRGLNDYHAKLKLVEIPFH